MICARCHRFLTRVPVYVAGMALGPKCAVAVAGSKPRRARLFTAVSQAVDARQQDLFGAPQP